MKSRFIYLSLTLFIVTANYGSCDDVPPINPVSSGLHDFSVTMMKFLYTKSQDNLVFSPLSVGAALGMISEGAKENTYSEIAKLLSLPEDVSTKRQSFQDIFKAIKERNSVNSVYIGDKAYLDEGFTILPEFLQAIKTYYDADAETIKFSENAEAAKVINNWVSDITKGRIPNIVNDESVNDATKLVLVNALYFNATWNKKFDVEDTSVQPFFRAENDKSDVNMMALSDFFLAAELEEINATVLELPYKNNEYTMLLLLPQKKDGLSEMLDLMDTFSILQIKNKLAKRQVRIKLPKFKIDTKTNLVEPLTKLGVRDMFDSAKANFTGMVDSESGGVYVTAAVHKAEIETTEAGTIASAATVVSVYTKKGVVSKLPTIQFNADHPFLFFILDRTTDVPLFAGAVTRPTLAS